MTTLTLLLFLLPLAYSPGPGNLFFAAHGARFGWRNSLPALFGYHAATLAAALAVGGGLLVCDRAGHGPAAAMGWQRLYIMAGATALARQCAAPAEQTPHMPAYGTGAALLALNPKAWAIMAALYAQFPSADWHTVGMGCDLVFTLNNAVAFMLWTGLGQTLLARIQNPAHLRRINKGFALLLAAVRHLGGGQLSATTNRADNSAIAGHT